MFNDRYGLTEAVLTGRKTMTRRIVPAKVAQMIDAVASPTLLVPLDCIPSGMSIEEFERQWHSYDTPVFIQPKSKEKIKFYDARKDAAKLAPYKIGEEIAIAQSYHTLNKMGFVAPEWCEHTCEDSAGYKNKMFVRADLMPHRIRITDIKVERLRDISDEDCGKEGIVHVEWKQWLKQEWNDFSPQRYKTHDVWTLPIFEESLLDTWSEQNGHEIFATDPQTAFFVLFSALAGKRPNDMTVSNPWVFAYSFELVQ